ncbi:phosphomethylpyrimidine synthase ThiC [Candidatus Omnitrophota bacterium]
MKTQLEFADARRPTPEMIKVAKEESVTTEHLLKGLSKGHIVIPKNTSHRIKKPCAIGTGLKTKVNVNLGTSTDKSKIEDQLKKLEISVKYKADTIMDLSVGGDLKKIRKAIIKESPIPVGTVPIYEAAIACQRKNGNFLQMDFDHIFDVLESQAQDGVDFFTIHCGITLEGVQELSKKTRILDIVSRGGAIIAKWMLHHKKENPFYVYFDKVVALAKKHDITLSLGDALRPGSVLDASDALQFGELALLGKLAKFARKNSVQVMIEGPGHVPINEIAANVLLEKQLCDGAPFYVLGPLVTDVAPGYDHISAAIGGAIAASHGADFLCYVTPAEHLRLPTLEDVKEGLIASRIAAHAADLAKSVRKQTDWDKAISTSRKNRDWKKQIYLSIDADKAKKYRDSVKANRLNTCSMCGEYCSIKLIEEGLKEASSV